MKILFGRFPRFWTWRRFEPVPVLVFPVTTRFATFGAVRGVFEPEPGSDGASPYQTVPGLSYLTLS